MLKKISRLSLVAWVVIIAAVTLFSTVGICAAADGILQVTVEKSAQNPIVGATAYLFNEAGTYLGQNQVTDPEGKVEFNLSEGTYKIRVDYLGYQFWSPVYTVDGNVSETLTIAHQDVTITVQGDYPSVEPISNIPVYLFTETGSYMSQSQTTDANGQVVFNLPEQVYKVRADYMSQQFWSDPFTWQNTTVTVPMADAEVTVIDAELPLEGIPVYVFTASGTYLNINDTTDADGKVTFHLTAGDYKFRADYQSRQYWSEEKTLTTGQVNPITISTGGGVLTFTVLKGASDPLVGVNCYAFTEGGTYLDMSAATDANGQVTFHFSDGSYKIRVDYLGYQFWSPVYTITGDLNETLTIGHQDVTITIKGNYPATEPLSGVPVYLFTEAGSYMSQSQTTDTNGQVVFNLPEQAYKVRADYLSQQFWSDPFTWQDTTVTVPMADAEVTVLDAGLTLEGIPVYVFTASGTYLNINDTTDADGKVTFHLTAGDYKFRADYQSSQYWSNEETLIVGQVNPINISTGGGVLTFTVLKGPSDPLAGVNCYAFTEGGTYLNMSAATDANGQVTFHFSDGSYKIRVDYLGYQFWSPVYTITGDLGETLTIPHQDVTITVQGNYPATEPLSGVPVYLFTEAGSYMSQSQTTDTNGQVVFNLPEQSYKVRADYMSQQFWSDPFTWQDATITISRGMAEVHVTRFGSDVPGASVYLFSQSGSYLGWFETTDANGKAQFVLPDRVYKFRADEGGDQAWSPEVQIIAGVVNPVEIDLSPITVTISADPESIEQGESSTLTWTSTGAESCSIEPGIGTVDLNGSTQVSPTETTTYTITATGSAGTAMDTAEVAVYSKKDIAFGLEVDEQQGGGGLVGETVRILNGNVVESRSDLSFPSPHRLGLLFDATYNSQSDLSGTLGFGWTHSYSATLDPTYEMAGQTYVKIVDQTGRVVYFTEDTPGIYTGEFNERSQVKVESGNYVWYRLNGSKFSFSAAGQLIWIEDAIGNRLELSYDANDLLQTVTDTASSRTLTFNYNVDDLLESITGPATTAVPTGVWVTYGYDAAQNLTSVTYADGSGFSYTYTDPGDIHNLTAKLNKTNHQINTWGYDAQDRCIDNFSVNGIGVSINYVSDTQVEVTDAYGTLRTYTIGEINGRKRVTAMQGPASAPYSDGNVVRWDYDSQMNLVEVETAGNTFHQYLGYDARGNPQTVIFASATTDERVITYAYHPGMNVALSREEASSLGSGEKVTIWDYDDDYDTAANENPTGLLTRIVEQGFTRDSGGSVVSYEFITTFTYNSNGQVLSIDGPLPGNGDTTYFTYDPITRDLLSITRPVIGSTGFWNYDSAGQVGLVTDVNGQSKSFTYDGKGRITVITNNADASTSSFIYNTAGLIDSRTDEDGVVSSFEYDTVYGRLTKRTDHEGNYITFDYDAQGNLIEKSYYDPLNTRTNWKRFLFQDPAHSLPGKLFKEINPDDTFTRYWYDSEGNVASVIDPNTNTTTYNYDPLNRLDTATQPGNLITYYSYDVHGNLISVTDAESHITSYEYDDMGRVLTTMSTDTGTVAYVYDEAGNLLNKTDAKGIMAGYDYDLINRLTNVNFPDPSQDITYTYDAGTNGMGRRTGMTDPSGSMTFGYDNRGRLTQKTSIVNGQPYLVSRAFTLGGRVSSVVYPTGRTVDYDRSVCACSVDSVSTTYNSNTVALLSNLSYRPFGIAKGMDSGNSGTVNNVFDQSGRLTVANPGAPKERTYTYDANGNLTSVSAPSVSWYNRTYTYDALSRLEHAEGPFGTMDFTYDGVGNRLTKDENSQTENYTYVTGTNKLQEVTGPVAYTYDANGNITGIGSKVLVYNQNNRLIRVEENSNILGEYTYSGLGQRVIKTASGVATVFHYDFNGNIIAESDLNGNFTKEYLYRGKGRLAMVDAASGDIYYYLNDRLGTPQIMTDATNTVIWEGVYKPFGEAEVNPNSSVVNNFRFAGQYFDLETGLHYNYHRYYDPATGRYLRPDPIGLLGGTNLYVYSKNNSINITDPTGLMGPAAAPLFIVGTPLLVGATYYALAPPEQQQAIESFIKNQILTSPLVMSAIAWIAVDYDDQAPYCEVRRRGRDPRILQPRPTDLGPLKGAPSLPYPGANIGSPDPNLPPKPPKPPKTFWEKVKYFVKQGLIRLPWIF